MSGVEGNHRAKGKKVTALVPGVENRIENAAPMGYAECCNLPSVNHISKGVRTAGFTPLFLAGIDFIPRVGYAYKTFAVRPLNDDWEK
jgi:hypothetical protein